LLLTGEQTQTMCLTSSSRLDSVNANTLKTGKNRNQVYTDFPTGPIGRKVSAPPLLLWRVGERALLECVIHSKTGGVTPGGESLNEIFYSCMLFTVTSSSAYLFEAVLCV